MDPIVLLAAAWGRVAWVFDTWLPSWWEALDADFNYIKHIGD